jgi:chromatin segregation and condensation protein Rec8/ScpA/Scc1 (kleisin family)
LIEDHLAERDEVCLSELAGDTNDRKVAIFLACLSLARQGRVTLVQHEPFSDIVIRPLDEAVDATA